MPPLTVPLSDISTGKSPEKIVTWNISSRHWKNSSKVWSWIAVVTVNRKLWARACISRRHNCSFPSKWKFWYQNFSILKSQHWKPVANNSSMVRFSTDKFLEFSILMEVPMLKLFHPEVLTSEWCTGQIFKWQDPRDFHPDGSSDVEYFPTWSLDIGTLQLRIVPWSDFSTDSPQFSVLNVTFDPGSSFKWAISCLVPPSPPGSLIRLVNSCTSYEAVSARKFSSGLGRIDPLSTMQVTKKSSSISLSF